MPLSWPDAQRSPVKRLLMQQAWAESKAAGDDTIEGLLELASKYGLECLFSKCELALTSTSFKLTTGNSLLDKHSAVRWIRVAQQHQLLAAQRRCEMFLCNNFHFILDDPLLQDLSRPSLLRMLRAQSATAAVYRTQTLYQHGSPRESSIEGSLGKRRRTCASHGMTSSLESLEGSEYDSQLGSQLSLDSYDLLSTASTSVMGPVRQSTDNLSSDELKSTAESRPAYATRVLGEPNDHDRPVLIMTRCWSSPELDNPDTWSSTKV